MASSAAWASSYMSCDGGVVLVRMRRFNSGYHGDDDKDEFQWEVQAQQPMGFPVLLQRFVSLEVRGHPDGETNDPEACH